MKKLVVVLLTVLSLMGCAEEDKKTEIGRIALTEISRDRFFTKEITLDLKQGEVISFWTDTAVSYENPIGLAYVVEVQVNGTNRPLLRLSALGEDSESRVKKEVKDGRTSLSFLGKIEDYVVEETGTYLFKAAIMASNDYSIELQKAVLILKK